MHTHKHTHNWRVRPLCLASVQIQTKPYGPAFPSFAVCVTGSVEGQEEPATPVLAGRGTKEEGSNKPMQAAASVWSKESLDPFAFLKIHAFPLPKATYAPPRTLQDERRMCEIKL